MGIVEILTFVKSSQLALPLQKSSQSFAKLKAGPLRLRDVVHLYKKVDYSPSVVTMQESMCCRKTKEAKTGRRSDERKETVEVALFVNNGGQLVVRSERSGKAGQSEVKVRSVGKGIGGGWLRVKTCRSRAVLYFGSTFERPEAMN